MPTYEYQCESCGHALEAFQSITAEPLSDCPSCEQSSLKRIISAGAGIVFKGSGFYETDYKRGADYQKKAKAETTGSASSANKADKKTETKKVKSDS